MLDDSEYDLRELAAEIARRIAADPSVSATLASNWPAQPGTPPKLCCFQGYDCATPFLCQRDFSCSNGFNAGDVVP
ncbi:hypothetical protein [Geomesophilobacter sediminis]|uniref:Uncharacterized protein n=1 Tax=Geomesophilobacter sediminis TaxID=2798584 RepID=A0A8J7LZI0_9BACT|nr:hypothetical protein [Geomesophilobacter sediminis]MBJ6726451.1 hypothetical protein [Geomesophilobacter sediminis]